MDTITRADLNALLAERPGPCVTVYLPAARGGGDGVEGRFARCLTEAEKGLPGPEAAEMLLPARALLADEDYWKHQEGGLAVFLAPGLFRAYRLPVEVPERVSSGPGFVLTPVLSMLPDAGHFFVLALSKASVRLLRCGPGGPTRVEVPGCPHGIEEAQAGHDTDKMLNYHTRHAGGRSEATYHGQGVGVDDRKDDVMRYFLAVDKALGPVLREEHAPAVLAGVGYLLPIFRRSSSYAHLTEEEVHGSPDRLSDRELFEKARPLAEPYLGRAREKAVGLYAQLAGTGRTAVDGEAAAATARGEVDVLFVREGAGADADRAVLEALRHGGRAYALPAERMPAGAGLAAIFRLPHSRQGKGPRSAR